MKLDGSCHCQKVRFSCESAQAVPFLKCYCSICRKLNGSSGYGINLGADFSTIKVDADADVIDVYHPGSKTHYSSAGIGKVSGRHFCRNCSTGLWNWDQRWPEIFHPYPSVIDTPLPLAPAFTHMMLEYKPDWVQLTQLSADKFFNEYPDESLKQWHQRMELNDE